MQEPARYLSHSFLQLMNTSPSFPAPPNFFSLILPTNRRTIHSIAQMRELDHRAIPRPK